MVIGIQINYGLFQKVLIGELECMQQPGSEKHPNQDKKLVQKFKPSTRSLGSDTTFLIKVFQGRGTEAPANSDFLSLLRIFEKISELTIHF